VILYCRAFFLDSRTLIFIWVLLGRNDSLLQK
jgi:hypothetical protein